MARQSSLYFTKSSRKLRNCSEKKMIRVGRLSKMLTLISGIEISRLRMAELENQLILERETKSLLLPWITAKINLNLYKVKDLKKLSSQKRIQVLKISHQRIIKMSKKISRTMLLRKILVVAKAFHLKRNLIMISKLRRMAIKRSLSFIRTTRKSLGKDSKISRTCMKRLWQLSKKQTKWKQIIRRMLWGVTIGTNNKRRCSRQWPWNRSIPCCWKCPGNNCTPNLLMQIIRKIVKIKFSATKISRESTRRLWIKRSIRIVPLICLVFTKTISPSNRATSWPTSDKKT